MNRGGGLRKKNHRMFWIGRNRKARAVTPPTLSIGRDTFQPGRQFKILAGRVILKAREGPRDLVQGDGCCEMLRDLGWDAWRWVTANTT